MSVAGGGGIGCETEEDVLDTHHTGTKCLWSSGRGCVTRVY